MDSLTEPLVPARPLAWRIALADATLRLPTHVEDALRALPDPDGLTILALPAGQATPYELQVRAEAWMAHDGTAPAEIAVRSTRVLWRPGRAVCFGPPADAEDVIAGLLHFALAERALSALEADVEAQWPAWQQDIALTHGVGRRELARQRHVNAMTAAAHGQRLRFVRLEAALETPRAALPPIGRRVFGELVLQAEALSRLRALDDAIEAGQELYDTANDRLLEYSYFRREYVIEILILIVLLVDLAANAVHFGFGWD